MYEDLTYSQLKELPDEQKREALVDLKEKYPTYREMAQKLGGNPVAIANLYMRVVEGKKPGRKKKEAAAVIEAPVVKKKRQPRTKPAVLNQAAAPEETPAQKPVAGITGDVRKTVSFTIGLDTEIPGDEAQARIQGIVGSLLKDKTYRVTLKVEEV